MSRTEREFYRSSIYKSLYYTKKTMKQLLFERNQILHKLNIKPSKPDNEQKIIEGVLLLFKESPLDLQEHELLVIKQTNTYYVFFSSDDSFVPVCKRCFSSVYISMKGDKGRVTCCNVKCKQCLLEEFEINQEYQVHKPILQFKIYDEPEKKPVKAEIAKDELEKIKKAVRKMLKE